MRDTAKIAIGKLKWTIKNTQISKEIRKWETKEQRVRRQSETNNKMVD